MRRVPLPIALMLCLVLVGVIWWHGTKDYDFLTPPSPAQIELARHRAAGELAHPSDLFAIEPVKDTHAITIKPPKPAPTRPLPIPKINIGDLTVEPTLDAWTQETGKPAASFINLGSELETSAQLTWALMAWERVLDSSSPSPEEREVALKAIDRLHETLPPWITDSKSAKAFILTVDAPADRLQLTTRAANNAAKIIGKASSGMIKVSSLVRKGRETAASPKLKVSFAPKNEKSTPSVETPSPKSAEEIEKEILRSVFKLIGSNLALRDDIKTLSTPKLGEPPTESLELRVTRLAWQKFGESATSP